MLSCGAGLPTLVGGQVRTIFLKKPARKFKAPCLENTLLEPANAEIVSKLMGACPTGYLGARDKAAILFLCDTGCRTSDLQRALDVAGCAKSEGLPGYTCPPAAHKVMVEQ